MLNPQHRTIARIRNVQLKESTRDQKRFCKVQFQSYSRTLCQQNSCKIKFERNPQNTNTYEVICFRL
ncbi:MAG: hypothetical protein DWI22_07960 [Planctomycetota bacterium]|nr:MAG: hypothetical protein DWI22_07960 [Planctomycetota bacterium]